MAVASVRALRKELTVLTSLADRRAVLLRTVSRRAGGEKVAGITAHGENCFLAFFPGSKTVHRNPAQLLQQQLKWAVGYKLLTKYPKLVSCLCSDVCSLIALICCNAEKLAEAWRGSVLVPAVQNNAVLSAAPRLCTCHYFRLFVCLYTLFCIPEVSPFSLQEGSL